MDSLVVAGEVSAFSRDLSPLQLHARGSVGGRAFELLGVLRKGRPGVRWNEWFLAFEDGQSGWLGEGNGFFELYDGPAQQGSLPGAEAVQPGTSFLQGKTRWRVIEAAEAEILAAEGELPFAAVQGQRRPYADLRSEDGRLVGTLDYADGPPTLYVGRIVTLQSLQLEGLRGFAGWSDPAIVAFSGPEVTAVRSLQCPHCGASLTLRNPGQSVRLGCGYCGSTLELSELGDESSARVLAAMDGGGWQPPIPLGTKGTVEGVPWEVIGAMVRAVSYEGIDYAWTEHFLWNPYRGQAFLTVDGRGHWNFVHRLPDLPAGIGDKERIYKAITYKHYTGGTATVKRVLGEFSWKVAAGDRAYVADFVAPPRMLSVERTGEEESWSLATYMQPDEVAACFGGSLPPAVAMAANKPNPWADPSLKTLAFSGALLLLGIVLALWIYQGVNSANQVLIEQGWLDQPGRAEIWLSDEFVLEDAGRSNLLVELDSDVRRERGQLQVALLNKGTGATYLPVPTRRANRGRGRIFHPEPGTYVARVELARPPGAKVEGRRQPVALKITRDVPWRTPLLWALLWPLLGPLGVLVMRGAFEGLRWSESDYA